MRCADFAHVQELKLLIPDRLEVCCNDRRGFLVLAQLELAATRQPRSMQRCCKQMQPTNAALKNVRPLMLARIWLLTTEGHWWCHLSLGAQFLYQGAKAARPASSVPAFFCKMHFDEGAAIA